MISKEKINKKLIDFLLKKASGFHYEEESYEYEAQKNKKAAYENKNLSFFDICDRGQISSDVIDDKIKVSNEGEINKGDEKLVLVKKKVTSHYIPPDMLAIKILLEMFGKEELDDIEKMTDDELIKFKNKIMKELKDED